MAEPVWHIALKGVNKLPPLDDVSCATLASLETIDPMTDPSWIKLRVTGVEANRKFIEGPAEVTGGIVVHRGAQFLTYRIVCYPFTFPDDQGFLNNVLMPELSKRYVFMYRGTYDFPNDDVDKEFRLHSDSVAICVAITGAPVNDWSYGAMNAEYEARELLPRKRPQ